MAFGVIPPITKLSNVPVLVGAISTDPVPVGFMWTWPVPVGLISTWAFEPLMLVETFSVKLSPPPAPMLNCVVPDAFLRDNPAELVA